MTKEKPVPTLFEWAGGAPALERWVRHFYARKVPDEPLLAPVFADMSADHAMHVAAFVGEVFGGPATYTERHGGHANMIRKHLGRNLTETQRRRWMELMLESADEVGLPSDPEFRAALVGYLEWGTRLAQMNSQPGAEAVEEAPMPAWNWGPPGGPWQPEA